ncbi:aldo-keto reductase [Rhizodiscina lignyota]|uniref:Aldo-keto reductase n=1 Tax=Rhizodiscina lignyota TaxID=1504668 RepID=A0A9P4IBR4_9PEZI|nr:aldo-keto reductase [Rhizodiscina lignyota]
MATSERPKALQQSIDETKVSYVKLGNAGLRVSVPILGAMSFGHKDWADWVVDDEEAVMDLLKGAYDRGLNTWDTANVYSNGVSEEMIGRAVRKFSIPREKLVLLTKCYGTVGETPAIRHIQYPEMKETKDYVNLGGLSRSAIFNAVNASLKRLQMDYIDLLQIHRFDYTVPVEETMEALHDLVKSGKVRYIGASSMWAYQFAQMQFVAEKNGWTKFVSMQNQYSLCYREEEREMNKFCHETGVGLIPWAPLYRGRLARPPNADDTARAASMKNHPLGRLAESDEKIIARVQELAEKKGWKMSQVSLAWIIQKNTIPIVGFSSLARLDEAAAVKGKTLTDEEIKYLEEPYQPRAIMGHS